MRACPSAFDCQTQRRTLPHKPDVVAINYAGSTWTDSVRSAEHSHGNVLSVTLCRITAVAEVGHGCCYDFGRPHHYLSILDSTMKSLAALAVLFVSIAGSAQADPWFNLYLADTGGSRLMQTNDPAEASYIYASVLSPDFVVLNVKCPETNTSTRISVGQQGSIDGPSFLSNGSVITFSVDSGGSHRATRNHFLQGAYEMTVPNQLIREMVAGTRLVMSYGPDRFQKKIFTLRGSSAAINAIDCTRMD